MKKIISVVLFVAVILSLATPVLAASQNLVYSKDSTLRASFVKYGNITVKSGVTLTIDKSSSFEVAGNITVEPGGRIVCNGVGSGQFTFSMCSKNSTITGMDFYYNFRTERGVELCRVAKGYEGIREMWLQYDGMMAPSFKWNETVQGWCLTGDSNINLTGEPVYHTERDMDSANMYAGRLNRLGLFKGTDKGYELDRPGSRVEAVTMLIRLLGKEEEALSGTWKHPFTDVPAWADKYVGYAYETGLTQGVSTTRFDSNAVATAQMYYTFLLRALGYTDSGNCKIYDQAMELIQNTAVYSWEDVLYELCAKKFWRADMVVASYRALWSQTLSGVTLGEKLVADGVFTEQDLQNASH